MKDLQKSLQNGEFLITTEVSPPKGTDVSKFIEECEKAKDMVHAIAVADAPQASPNISTIAASAILIQNGITPICLITCRDRNRLGLQSDLLGAWSLGIRNIIALTGEAFKMSDHAKAVFELDAIGLISLINNLNYGLSLDNRILKGKTDFLIGAAVDPNRQNQKRFKKRFEEKIKAGAKFFLSQPTFNSDKLKILSSYARSMGAKILSKIIFLYSAKQARNINKQAPEIQIRPEIIERLDKAKNPAKMGTEIAIEQIESQREFIDGIHVMPFSYEDSTQELIKRIGLACK